MGVVASTFDEPADRHVRPNLVLEKAKRMVECGHDVCILLDSITRLARAYNTVSPSSGKILWRCGSQRLAKTQALFGAREHSAFSLSIIATALTETGSKMDEVIFEEFKERATWNSSSTAHLEPPHLPIDICRRDAWKIC